jgi:hypothetical protein
MSDIKNQEHIDALRRRLYERGSRSDQVDRHKLTPQEIEVSRGWTSVSGSAMSQEGAATPTQSVALAEQADEVKTMSEPMPTSSAEKPYTPPRRRYRLFIMVGSLILFLLATAISSVYLFFGGNQISADNIALTVDLPEVVAGGEVVPIQIGVANQNSVTIESPILIVNYPAGTRSSEDGNRELYEERVPLESILSGQARNIPLRAVFYGEQGQEKEVRVAIEYRVQGSSGAFYKEADAKQLTISSSPVAVRLGGVESISSGQVLDLTITVESNSDTPQKNVLVNASFPDNFSFEEATPEPAYGENSWLISELPARGTVEIAVSGIVTSLETDTGEIEVKVGTPQLNNQFLMGSVLSQSFFTFTVDKPFTGVVLGINDDTDGTAVIPAGDEATVSIVIENTLDTSMRSLRVVARPTGNLIRDDKVVINEGYYDASAGSIRFDETYISNLAEVISGDTRTLTFRVRPDEGQVTAGFSVNVEVFAKREGETVEALIGTASAEAKYSSVATIGSQLGYDNGPFTDEGAIPPVAGKKTTYTVTFVAEAGVNDMTNAVMTANLPNYVSWREATSGDGSVSYDAEKKQIRWVVGDVSANESKSIDVQVELLPTTAQVGRTAVVVGAIELRATDRFTGVTLRSTARDVNTELSTELGFVRGNGVIIAAE